MTERVFVDAEDMPREKVRWIVGTTEDSEDDETGIIPDNGVGILYGPSWSGKSFVADVNMAIAIANGESFLGHSTTKGDVVIAIAEGQDGIGKRQDAYMYSQGKKKHSPACPNKNDRSDKCPAGAKCRIIYPSLEGIFFWKKAFSIIDPMQRRRFVAVCKKTSPAIRLVIFDTLRYFSGGLSLSNATTAGRVMAALREIAESMNCFVLAISHTNKDDKTMAGSPVLFQESDIVIAVRKEHLIECDKVKDGEPFASIMYEIKPVKWTDPARKEERRSAVVVLPESEDIPRGRRKVQGVPKVEPVVDPRANPDREPVRELPHRWQSASSVASS